jgi:GDP-D-mannose 3',5'-epimerase
MTTTLVKVTIAGGAGFIGSHVGMYLKRMNNEDTWTKFHVTVVDIKSNEFLEEKEYCDEFLKLDLQDKSNCIAATKGSDWVFNFAANMGGMGFIHEQNDYPIYRDNMTIDMNMIESVRINKVQRYFYASSACVYPEYRQNNTSEIKLKESYAWPAQPQGLYGFEKLAAEQLCIAFGKEYPTTQVRIARFHNIYGPAGTWKDGREKAPAAICRKVICSKDELEIWGDGEQVRSFCFIEDAVQAIYKLISSSNEKLNGFPLNIGSEEMVSVNELSKIAMSFESKQLRAKHLLEKPQGVRGRNSDNSLVRELLQWEPTMTLEQGMRNTYMWIKQQIETNIKDKNSYASSVLVTESEK